MLIALPQVQGLIWPQQSIGWLKGLQRFSDHAFFIRSLIYAGCPIFIAAIWWVLFDFFKDICKAEASFPYVETTSRKRKLLAGLSILPPVAWFLASDRWLLGKRTTRSTLNYFWCASFAVVIGVLIYAGHRIYDQQSGNLFWFAEKVVSYPEEYSAPFYLFFIGSTILFQSVFVFCLTALAYSLAPCQLGLRDRLRRGVPFIVGLVVLSSMLLGFKMLFRAYGMNGRGFMETLNLPDKNPEIKSALILSSDKNGVSKVSLQSLPIEAQLVGYVTESVPATSSNLSSIESYIKNHQRTFYRSDAYDVEALGHYANWDVVEGSRWLQAAAMGGGSLISRMIGLAVVGIGPTTPENKAYLEKWADESIWWHSVIFSAKLARLYALYGDQRRARYFENKAVMLQNTDERDTRLSVQDIHQALALPPQTVTNGRIVGRLVLGTGVSAPERIGLFYLVPVGNKPFHGPDLGGPTQLSTIIGLRDAKAIGRDLTFTFSNVRNGVYCIAFMFNSDKLPPSSRIVVKNNPGYFQIDRQKPVKDLRVINISRS